MQRLERFILQPQREVIESYGVLAATLAVAEVTCLVRNPSPSPYFMEHY
jgi:hypothetical protein